jgi:outer membrane protein assembly factor BamD (BamD/ComL family)
MMLAGCTGVPAKPAWAQNNPPRLESKHGEDPYEGRLLRWGGRSEPATQAQAPQPPAATSGQTTMAAYPGTAPPAGYAPAGYTGPAAAPGPYPGQAPPSGYPSPTPPPGYQGGVVQTSYQNAYPDTGLPPVSASQPPNPGMVPVGGIGVAPAGPDVVPSGVMGPPPPGPNPPPGGTALTGAPRNPVLAAPSPDDSDGPKEDKGGWDISKLAPENVLKDLKKATGFGPDKTLAKTAFQEGEALFRQKKFNEAAEKFSTASWRWPDSAMEEDSMFLLSECYFFTDRYGKADDSYANLLKKYENTRYLDTVMAREFAIGRYWEQMDIQHHRWPTTPNLTDKSMPWFDALGNAIAAYDRVRLHDPTGPLADDAVMATANAYFRNARWEDAAYHYDILRRDYPKSQFQKEAHVLGLQAKWRMYQGSMYDGKPLEEAKEIAQQTLTQFPGKLGEEEARVAETRARINEQAAEREWAMGQFYEKKRAYGSARFYYRSVIEKYPRTQVAERAKVRMDEIRDKPDTPPDYLEWLKKIADRKR